ncbi:OmpH family outer membrane protein [Sinimarinibacterium sp. NLF-5-8]|uniref:OmpH family outer membrane protein n=1 Tax=Sinimarinibacterium sp. NLF-5-8 TaxID=2698684 RepID=UPI00137BE498|nr:OmpH family outer membrane protein [Sinimarinibacterium sp. NLF-5-8]QHS08969.1 OmpH family outer membrane protein [Sinimarinibacterium sp. NLF-5-8]
MNMFKTTLLAAGLVLSASVAVPAFAQGKIVAIRSNDLLQQSPQFKDGQDKMKQEFERRANDLQAETKKFAEDAQAFQREAELLSSADRARKEKDLNTRKIDLEYKARQFQEERTTRERQLFADMMEKVKIVIDQVAKEQSAVMVVENPVYADASLDITDEVLKRLKAAK